jgi:hypothetical protein
VSTDDLFPSAIENKFAFDNHQEIEGPPLPFSASQLIADIIQMEQFRPYPDRDPNNEVTLWMVRDQWGNVSDTTCRTRLRDLCKQGVLVRRKVRKKNGGWEWGYHDPRKWTPPEDQSTDGTGEH